MIIVVEVGLALQRPPVESHSTFVIIDEEVVGFDFAGAEARAQALAANMAMAIHNAVMPVRTTILEIREI